MRYHDDHRPIEAPVRSPLPGDTRHGADYSLHFLLLAIAGFFVARIPVIPYRIFDPDEFQHSHAAWCVWKGMVPYKDFFEHHTPWYYYALRPFFHWFDVDISFESARHFLIFGRGLSLVLTILSVFLVFLIGRLWEDRRMGLMAGLFCVSQPVFFHKTIEIRPDVLALPFFLGGLWFLLGGLARSTDVARRGLRWFLGGGLCLGAAIMCTQKMLFVLPGMLAGLAIWSLFAGTRGVTKAGPRSRILLTMAFFLGIAVPAALTWTAFTLHHAGGEFIANNFLLNSKWTHVAHEQLIRLLKSSWPVLILSLLGASVSLYRFFRSKQRQYGGILLLCVLVGLSAGILVVPVAHRQYYLMPLPIACLFAAKGLSFLVERARERARAWLLIVATIPLLVLPVLDLREAFTQRNDRQLARLRHVFESTKPTDLVMDGWEGTGVFRPHAFYYYFLHDESVAMVPREQVDAYVDALERGKIRPRLIALDEHLVALGSRFLRFVKTNYVSSDGFFYFSKGGFD
jgi:4-amino-4-deoxy-L-arabinose transferase-like glycosyltransferase